MTSARHNPDKKKRRAQSPERKAEMTRRKGIRKFISSNSQMVGVPASINRHTGELHEHKREKARRVANQKFTV